MAEGTEGGASASPDTPQQVTASGGLRLPRLGTSTAPEDEERADGQQS